MKCLPVLAVGFLSVTTYGFANNFDTEYDILRKGAVKGESTDMILSEADLEEALKKSGKMIGSPKTDCASFAGNWQGTCTITKMAKGKEATTMTKDVSLMVEQDGCSEIELGDILELEIGSLENETVSSERGVKTEKEAAWWMDNNTVGFDQDYQLIFYGEDGAYYQLALKGKLQKTDLGATLKVGGKYISKKMNEKTATKVRFKKNCELTMSIK